MSDTPFLIVGLGNPGREYAHHRHNIGFMAVDEIARQHNFTGPVQKFHGQLFTGQHDGRKILLLKPETYMNDSGRSVQAAAAFYKIGVDNIAVIHDELDLAPGIIRTKRGGGAAGHNGLRSIDAALGKDYARIRIGIGHPGDKDMVTPYVLGNFSIPERLMMDELMNNLARALPAILSDDAKALQALSFQATV